jgi:glycosyltransferase involved in cell wall biosynthesis
MPPLIGSNELGFWEPEAVVQAHEEFLAAIDSSWDDVAPLPDGAFTATAALEFRQRLTLLLQDEYGTSPLFVVKDPRISRLLPLWFAVLAELQVAPSTAIAVRNPLEVAASLKARDGFTTTKSLLLWLRHTLESELHSRGRQRTIVMYDELLRDWQGALARVGDDLKITWPSKSHRTDVEIENFLSAVHRHHAFDWRDLEGRVDVVSWVKETYFALRASDSRPVLDQVRDELSRADIAFGPIVEEARLSLRASQEQASEASAARDLLANEVTTRDHALGARALEVEQLQEEVGQLNSVIAASASRAAAHQAEVVSLRAEREGLTREVERIGAEVSGLVTAAETAETRIAVTAAEAASTREELDAVRVEAERLRTAADAAASVTATLEANSSAERGRLMISLEAARADITRLEEQVTNSNIALDSLEARAATEREELHRELRLARADAENLSERLDAAKSAAATDRSKTLAELEATKAEVNRLAIQLNNQSREGEALSLAADELLSTAAAELSSAQVERDRLKAEAVDRLEEHRRLLALAERLEGALEAAFTALSGRDQGAAEAALNLESARAEAEGNRAEVQRLHSDLKSLKSEAANERVALIAERDSAWAQGKRLLAELEEARTHAERLATGVSDLDTTLRTQRAMLHAMQSVTRRRTPRRRSLSHFGTWLLPPTPTKLNYVRRYFLLRRHGTFDVDSYLLANPDVLNSGLNPLMHYVEYGSREGRLLKPALEPRELPRSFDPAPAPIAEHDANGSRLGDRALDSTLQANPEANRAFAQGEGKLPDSPTAAVGRTIGHEFDANFYRLRYPDVTGTNSELLDHYLTVGWREHRDPCSSFSTAYYLAHNPDIRKGEINPFVHYLSYGRTEGRLPNAYRATKLLRGYSPTISAIVPAFNHVAFIKRRIESIVTQARPPSEIVILDDGSTDGTRELIDELRRDIDIPVITEFNEQNSGNVFTQWRKGLSLASGDLAWICESDDFCSENLLSLLVPYLADPSVTLAFGRIQFSDEGGIPGTWLDHYRENAAPGYWDAPRIESAYKWFRGPFGRVNVIPNVGGCIFRRQSFSTHTWREAERYSVCGDWFLYMQIAGGGRIAYDPEAVSYFRQHGDNTSVSSFTELAYYREHAWIASALRRRYGIDDSRLGELYRKGLEQYLTHFPQPRQHNFNQIFDLQSIIDQSRETQHVLMGILGFKTGGAELFAVNLANALVDRGYIVSVLVLDADDEVPSVRERLRPEIPVYERGLVQEIGMDHFFKDYGFDLVHTHNLGVDRWIHEECRDAGLPYVVTLHGSYEVEDLDPETKISLLGSVDHWVYVADKNLDVFDGLHLNVDSFTKVANAVPEASPDRRFSRAEFGIPEDAFVFGVASRALKAKGWDIAAEGLAKAAAETGRPLYLALCGDGDDYDELVAEYSGRRGVLFLGHQSDVVAFYRMCDCCILPTRFRGESFPLTLIESLSAGTPTIATDIGEIRAMIESDGVAAGIVLPLIESDEEFATEVAAAMSRMLSEQTQFAEGAKRLARNYSFKRLTSEYEEVYRSTVDGPSRSIAAAR